MIKKHIHCPVNGWDCPYYTNIPHPCSCTLENPFEECDDFASMWDEEDDWHCIGECKGCQTCSHAGAETTNDVACCNCCDEYEYYEYDERV